VETVRLIFAVSKRREVEEYFVFLLVFLYKDIYFREAEKSRQEVKSWRHKDRCVWRLYRHI